MGKGIFIGIGLLVLIVVGVYFVSAPFYAVHQSSMTVKKHFIDYSGSGNSGQSYYVVVTTDGKSYEVQNVFAPWINQTNADVLWANVNDSATYCATYVGLSWIVPWANIYWYPNIVQLKDGAC